MRSLLVACLLWLGLTASAWAASALDYTRATLEEARAIVASERTHNEKLQALSSLFKNFLDTDEMGRVALGEHWASFTPTQRKEFLVLFGRLLERTYVQKTVAVRKTPLHLRRRDPRGRRNSRGHHHCHRAR